MRNTIRNRDTHFAPKKLQVPRIKNLDSGIVSIRSQLSYHVLTPLSLGSSEGIDNKLVPYLQTNPHTLDDRIRIASLVEYWR